MDSNQGPAAYDRYFAEFLRVRRRCGKQCSFPACGCSNVSASDHARGADWWDRWHMQHAITTASASRDPSTKCGAVIVRPDKTHAGLGFNGFPRGMSDDPALYANREVKLTRTIHAEMNALANAQREPVNGYTLYVWPYIPCSHCAIHVIQWGIKRVVASPLESHPDRWRESMARSLAFFAEAGVEFTPLDMDDHPNAATTAALLAARNGLSRYYASLAVDESNPVDLHYD